MHYARVTYLNGRCTTAIRHVFRLLLLLLLLPWAADEGDK